METIKQVQVVTAVRDANQETEETAMFGPSGSPLSVSDLPVSVLTTATAIGTAAKTIASPEPAVNTLVAIKFTSGNSAASPTVAFNGGTARNILLGGTASAAIEITLAAGGVALFLIDGTSLNQTHKCSRRLLMEKSNTLMTFSNTLRICVPKRRKEVISIARHD